MGVIEKRRIWTDEALADYIRDELGFPGARQGAMVEKEAVDIATGEVSRERWYLLTSLSSRRCGPKELLRGFRNHWSAPNSLHHVKSLPRGHPGTAVGMRTSTPCAVRDWVRYTPPWSTPR